MVVLWRQTAHIGQERRNGRQELRVQRRRTNADILGIQEVVHDVGDVSLLEVDELGRNAFGQETVKESVSHLVG